LASEAKTRDYNVGELEKELEEFRALSPKTVGKFPNKAIRRLFYEKQLDDIYFYYKKIEKMADSKTRALFLLALIDTTARVANVVKVGGSLRKQKKPKFSVKKLFLGKVKKMIIDLKKAYPVGPEPEVFEGDARQIKLEENSVGAVITSPPYLNKIEYTSVYKMELGLFFNKQETKLRAHIQDSATGRDFETKMPLMAKAYFDDMRKVLENMFYYLKPGGKAIIVVGGGCFPYETVESDDVLIKEAEKIGLVNKTVPDGDEFKVAKGIAGKIVMKGQVAVQKGLKAIVEGQDKSLKDALSHEADLFAETVETEDMKEGLKAFLEKRQPQFKDR